MLELKSGVLGFKNRFEPTFINSGGTKILLNYLVSNHTTYKYFSCGAVSTSISVYVTTTDIKLNIEQILCLGNDSSKD